MHALRFPELNILLKNQKWSVDVWVEHPENGIYGTLYIHRQRCRRRGITRSDPIGEELKRIIEDSRDSVASPYVVHRIPERNNKRSKEVSHPTQVAPDYLSRSFSALRDKIGLCDHLPMEERPTFHEIRALAAHLFDSQGIDPQARMAHSDAKSTKIYT
jgi:integrase